MPLGYQKKMHGSLSGTVVFFKASSMEIQMGLRKSYILVAKARGCLASNLSTFSSLGYPAGSGELIHSNNIDGQFMNQDTELLISNGLTTTRAENRIDRQI